MQESEIERNEIVSYNHVKDIAFTRNISNFDFIVMTLFTKYVNIDWTINSGRT